MALSSAAQTPPPSSGETSHSLDDRQPPTEANGHGQLGQEKGRGTPLRSVSTPVSKENGDEQPTNHKRPSIPNDSDSDAGTGTETPRPFRPSLIRSNTSTRTMVRIPSQSVPPSGMGSRRPSDKSAHGENGRVNADDLFEREEDREARTQMDDFYKEFCESRRGTHAWIICSLMTCAFQLSTCQSLLDPCLSVHLIVMCVSPRKLRFPMVTRHESAC